MPILVLAFSSAFAPATAGAVPPSSRLLRSLCINSYTTLSHHYNYLLVCFKGNNLLSVSLILSASAFLTGTFAAAAGVEKVFSSAVSLMFIYDNSQ